MHLGARPDLRGFGDTDPEPIDARRGLGRSADAPVSPRSVLLSSYVKPPFSPDEGDLDRYVTSMLSTRVGDDFYPGDSRTAKAWPGVMSGGRGILNTMAAVCPPRPMVAQTRAALDALAKAT